HERTDLHDVLQSAFHGAWPIRLCRSCGLLLRQATQRSEYRRGGDAGRNSTIAAKLLAHSASRPRAGAPELCDRPHGGRKEDHRCTRRRGEATPDQACREEATRRTCTVFCGRTPTLPRKEVRNVRSPRRRIAGLLNAEYRDAESR